MPGLASLDLSVTSADLTEGFALDPTGFESELTFLAGIVQVVPEPGSDTLLGLGLVALGVFTRRRK